MKHPYQLQVNTAGAWKTVVPFGPGGHRRIVSGAGTHPCALAHMGSNTYGQWMHKEQDHEEH